MEPQDIMKNAFSYAWDNFFDCWVVWCKYICLAFLAGIGILLSGFGIYTVSQFFSGELQAFIIVSGVVFLLYLLFSLHYVVVQNMFDIYDKKEQRGFTGFPIAPRVIMTVFVYWLLVGLGTLALVIPGIIFAGRFGFAYYISMETDLGVINSLRRSWNMTRGYTGYLILLALISSALSSVALLNFLTMPFFMIVYINLYRYLMQKKSRIN